MLAAGETRSEGGFAENKVSVASLLDVQEAKDQKGKTYYKYEILTRTGPGALWLPKLCVHWGLASCDLRMCCACAHQPTAMRAAATS